MTPEQRQSLQVLEQLRLGDRIELTHEVKVGFRKWQTVTTGKVIHIERRRHGLHHRRNGDDKVFSDVLVLEQEQGERTTVTLDDFSVLKLVEPAV